MVRKVIVYIRYLEVEEGLGWKGGGAIRFERNR